MTDLERDLDRRAVTWRKLFHAEADAWSDLVVARCNFNRETEAMDLAHESLRMAMKRYSAATRALAEHVAEMRAKREAA